MEITQRHTERSGFEIIFDISADNKGGEKNGYNQYSKEGPSLRSPRSVELIYVLGPKGIELRYHQYDNSRAKFREGALAFNGLSDREAFRDR